MVVHVSISRAEAAYCRLQMLGLTENDLGFNAPSKKTLMR